MWLHPARLGWENPDAGWWMEIDHTSLPEESRSDASGDGASDEEENNGESTEEEEPF